MSESNINIGVVGAGYWGKNLIRNFYELGYLHSICEQNTILLDTYRTKYSNICFYNDYNEFLTDPQINAIVIATPAETHYTIAKKAINSNKHVFIEKPIVLNPFEGEELIALSKKKKTTLMVGHLLQYHPAFEKLNELINSGELGRINYIYSNRLNFGKIRTEENILWSFAPHDISMLLALAGENPSKIIATGGNYLHENLSDVTTSHFEFPSGIKAHIFVSWLHPFKEQKIVIVGNKKMAVFDDMEPWDKKLYVYPHKLEWKNHIPIPVKKNPEYIKISNKEPLKAECEHFIHCIEKKIQPKTDGQEGLQVLKILNACQKSIDTKKEITLNTKELREQKKLYIHDSSDIDEMVTIGEGTKIWHFCHILKNTKIGEHCNIGQNVMIGPDVNIGNNCKIQNNVSIYKGVTLENNIFCGPSIVFTNVLNPRSEINRKNEIKKTLIKNGSTIGANSTIVCGVTLGEYCFIGAGSVVTKDVPSHALVKGNPAHISGWMCQCGNKLNKNFKCDYCNTQYVKQNFGLEKITEPNKIFASL